MDQYLGKHWLIEFYNCDKELLAQPKALETIMKEAAEKMKATIVSSSFHHFSPLGVSGVVVIKESHLTLHSWPEYGYAAVDIFTCGDIEMKEGVSFLKETFKATIEITEKINRGNLAVIKKKQSPMA